MSSSFNMAFGLLLFSSLGALVVVFLVAERRRQNQLNVIWAEAAERLGLEFFRQRVGGRPTVWGNYGGFSVQVRLYRKEHGLHRARAVIALSYPRPLALGLQIQPAGLASHVGRRLGAEQISVGDERFDELFAVKGRDTEAVRRFLTPTRRASLQRLARYPRLCVRDDGIDLDVRAWQPDTEGLVSIVRELAQAAAELVEEPSATA